MDKAFDFAVLEQRLKDKGLTAVEGVAKIVSDELCGWISDSCMASSNTFLKALGPLAVASLKPVLDAQIAKIDGK